MTVLWLVIIAGAAMVALAFPPLPIAEGLLGVGTVPVGVVAIGLWLWKILFVLHAVLIWVWIRREESLATSAARPSAVPIVKSPPQPRYAAADSWLTADRAAIALASIFAIGLAVRVVGLGDGLWFDEIKMHVLYMTESLGRIAVTYDDQNQHLLYSLLAKISILTFGDSAIALRLPAVVFGLAGIWSVYFFGIRVTGRREALLAALLIAVSSHHVWFSQNARGYTGLLFFTLVSSALFIDLLRNEDRERWKLSVAYGGMIALALYTHLTAAVLPVAHVLIAGWAVWGPLPDTERRPALLPLVAGVVLAATLSLQFYAPVLPQVADVLLEPSFEGTEIEWKSPVWAIGEAVRAIVSGVPGGWLGLLAGLGVGGYGLWAYWRRWPTIALTMVAPVAATGIAIVGLGHNLWPRFFFFAAGFAVLIGIRGLFALADRLPKYGSVAATVLALLVAVGSLLTVGSVWGPKQDYEGAEAFVDESATPEDAVVVVDMTELPYDLWRQRDDWHVVRTAEELAQVEQAAARTWLLYSFPTSLQALKPDVWERIESEYREAGRFEGTVRGGDIHVMVRE